MLFKYFSELFVGVFFIPNHNRVEHAKKTTTTQLNSPEDSNIYPSVYSLL